MATGKGSHIELSLFGQKIQLKHREQDPALVEEVVKLVNEKVRQAQSRAGRGSAPHHVALIALMDLAAEYLQARERTEEFKGQVDRKCAELLARVEALE